MEKEANVSHGSYKKETIEPDPEIAQRLKLSNWGIKIQNSYDRKLLKDLMERKAICMKRWGISTE